MKILFVVDNYMGGAGNIVQLLAMEYAKEHEVSVALTHCTIEKRHPCPGVVFHELRPEDKPAGSLSVVVFQIRWLRKIIREEKPDVVLSFLSINSIIIALGDWRKKIPMIACVRNDPFLEKMKNRAWDFLLRLAYSRADLITVQFSAFAKMYGGRFEAKCRVTPNFIAMPDRLKTIELRKGLTRFVTCGRLVEQKQFEMLLEMFAEIHKQDPATELRIYGSGPLEQKLKNKIVALGLEKVAFLAGYTTDTYGSLCSSDVYLMSSAFEGFPNALSEALAVGLPSVSFACHEGIDILLDHGRRGISVPLNDCEAFVSAALELCRDREKCKKISDNAKEVCEIYSMENVKKTWDACIAEAIEKREKKKRNP